MSSSSLQPTAHNDAVYKMGVRSPGPLRVQFDGPGPAVLRLVLLEHKGWVEWDEETDGPHDWHLHWRSTRFKPSHYKLALPFQRLNHLPRSSIITKKDTLQKNLRKFHKVNGSVFDFYPQGFILPTEYTKFLKEYQRTEAEQPIWICKPADLSRGRKITLVRNIMELRYDQNTVIQRYIADPLTVGGYKLDLRLYVLVTSVHPLRVFLHKEGMVRFGTEKYTPDTDLTNLYSHLTNASINKHSDTYQSDKDEIGGGSKWMYSKFVQYTKDHDGINLEAVWPHIITLINCTLLMLPSTVPPNPSCFELLGFDVMLDQSLKPWLVEVNCSPALGMDCQVDRDIKIPLITDMVDVLQMEAARSLRKRCSALDARKVDSGSRMRRSGSTRRTVRGGARGTAKRRPPPPASKRNSKPSHPRAAAFRPAGARGVRSSSSSRTITSNTGTSAALSGKRGRVDAGGRTRGGSRGSSSELGGRSSSRSSSRDGGSGDEPSDGVPGGGPPSSERKTADAGTEPKPSGEAKSGGAAAVCAGSGGGSGGAAASNEGKAAPEDGPDPSHGLAMEGAFGGLVDGSMGNFELIFPFNDTTEMLSETLSMSVARGDAPLVVNECLKDIIAEVRTRDRQAAKQWRRQRKEAADKAKAGAAAAAAPAPAAPAPVAAPAAANDAVEAGAGGSAGAGAPSE